MRAPTEPPFVTAVLPALDEERYLERCVHSLLEDGPSRDRLEILILDGGSSDATRSIAERLARELPFLRLLDNPARLQSAAFNVAMREADPRATYLVRCDVHAEYPAGFVSRAVARAQQTGAVLVAFGAATAADGCFQAAVAFAQTSPVGVGDSSYRLAGRSGWVDHGMHGCFLRSAVEAAGGYDEGFGHNEDAELSLRLREAGGRIWLDGELAVSYYPRDSLTGLARQYWLYGRGRAATCIKHGVAPRARQLAPALLVPWHALALAAAPRRPAVLLAPAAYLAALGAISAAAAVRRREPCLLMAPAALATMHHAWGAGFLGKVLPEGLSRWRSRRRATRP